MQEKHLYEYAVIRVVPKMEREEFVNVGIILFCKRERFIKVIYKINEEKLRSFSNDLDFEQLEKNLESFEKISQGKKDGGPIAQFDVPSRFRWLTAVRSSVIQTSRPHPGLCSNLDDISLRLFTELVL
ncbi:DUF3037 domain-containing protein [Flavobacterium macacae]|uniref:DUF3037 domain-containing protein n=1 Tax=Flavobacterium macacae TaxID=2488993 RepID=A0A3P3W1W5_9FLAO|nr:DUF3037 domain-containing protein [Flavobacterium macacae]RRJ88980.1 DUF3037 domain-containing protein [Flavobacterium macacae]